MRAIAIATRTPPTTTTTTQQSSGIEEGMRARRANPSSRAWLIYVHGAEHNSPGASRRNTNQHLRMCVPITHTHARALAPRAEQSFLGIYNNNKYVCSQTHTYARETCAQKSMTYSRLTADPLPTTFAIHVHTTHTRMWANTSAHVKHRCDSSPPRPPSSPTYVGSIEGRK